MSAKLQGEGLQGQSVSIHTGRRLSKNELLFLEGRAWFETISTEKKKLHSV